MIGLIFSLIAVSFVLAWIGSLVLTRLGHRMGHLDAAGVDGQVKADARGIPNTGGIAITLAIVLPMAVLMLLIPLLAGDSTSSLLPDALREHAAGLASQTGQAWLLIAGVVVLHVLGLVDDRKPMGPRIKLGVMTLVALTLTLSSPETRLLVLLDAHVGGSWLSIALTVLWFLAVINAMNFLDNMDALAAGVVAVVSACFLVTTLGGGQWFVSAMLALVLGAVLGFGVLNRPPAKLFMGDGGSLVLGLLLAFLTVRTTYVDPTGTSGSLHAALMPMVVLAVPLYDLVSVVVIRISQGKSPMVGDLQHLSHRLVQRGLSKTGAVGLIVGLTAATGIAGMLLAQADTRGAWLIGVQTVLLLALLAAFERGSIGLVRDHKP